MILWTNLPGDGRRYPQSQSVWPRKVFPHLPVPSDHCLHVEPEDERQRHERDPRFHVRDYQLELTVYMKNMLQRFQLISHHQAIID